jgi:hypothetical protein
MRIIAIIAAALAVASCASAVHDSLERRGVDSGAVLQIRVDEAVSDARLARASLKNAADALRAVDSLSESALPRQIEKIYAAGADAGVRAQDLRASTDSMKSAGARFLSDRAAEIGFMDDPAHKAAEQAKLDAARDARTRILDAFTGANLRANAAVTVYNAEAAFMRRNISAAAVASRASERASALSLAEDAISALDSAISQAAKN